uniref:Uncharacterized protein n=1 Tax=Octopus bimaculoides TaxID=37653 RepID=A0A0L8GVS8_OCTBM
MKLVLLFLVLLPIVFAASFYDEEVDKRFSLSDLIQHVKNLDLSGGCVQACEDNVKQFWTFMCELACKTILGNSGN